MPKTAWPTGADVLGIVSQIPDVAQGLISAPTEEECGDLAEAALDDFQELTGRLPFLASGSSTRTFDPPDGRSGKFRLPVQLLSISQLLVNVTPGSNTGTAYTFGTDYLLGDPNAPALGMPYEWIDFHSSVFNQPQSILITAVFGYGTTIPMDAWQAVRRMAAASAIEQSMGVSGPVRAFKQRSLSREFGIRGQRTMIDDFVDDYQAAVLKYTFIPRQ